MAITATQNAAYFSGPIPQQRKMLATDAKTWKAGEFGLIAAAGTVEPVVTGSTAATVVFAEDQDSATSTSTVKVYLLDSSETRWRVYVSNGANDAVAATTQIGQHFGIRVTSNITTLDVGETGSLFFRVRELYPNIEAGTHAIADNPGQVIASVLTTVLEADAS